MDNQRDRGVSGGLGRNAAETLTREASSALARRRYDSASDELSTAIVFTVAEAADVDPPALREAPLYDHVDAEALERTFFTPGTDTEGVAEFPYAGYLVSVDTDGWVRVYDGTDDSVPV